MWCNLEYQIFNQHIVDNNEHVMREKSAKNDKTSETRIPADKIWEIIDFTALKFFILSLSSGSFHTFNSSRLVLSRLVLSSQKRSVHKKGT